MKKYFMDGVDEPLEFGDKIGFDIFKEVDDKSVRKNVEVNFIPEVVPFLLELGIIEEKEVEEDKKTIDFTEDAENSGTEDDKVTLDDVANDFVAFSTIVTGILEKMTARLKKLEDAVGKQGNAERSYVTISDYLKRCEEILTPLRHWSYNPDAFKVYCSVL